MHQRNYVNNRLCESFNHDGKEGIYRRINYGSILQKALARINHLCKVNNLFCNETVYTTVNIMYTTYVGSKSKLYPSKHKTFV